MTSAVGGLYLWLIASQDAGSPAGWFVAGLSAGIALGVGSLVRSIPGAAVLGFVGGAVLTAMGVVGILSVGLPLLRAELLMVLSAVVQVILGARLAGS